MSIGKADKRITATLVNITKKVADLLRVWSKSAMCICGVLNRSVFREAYGKLIGNKEVVEDHAARCILIAGGS